MENNFNHPDIHFQSQLNLSKYSTMQLEARGDLFTVRSVEGLKLFTKKMSEASRDYSILGLGANQLLRPTSKLQYLKLDFPTPDNLEDHIENGGFLFPANLSLARLTKLASVKNLGGWEVFTGVPATLGGAIAMNAGTRLGEIGPLILRVWTVDRNGVEHLHRMTENSFSYRKNNFLSHGEIIYQVELKPCSPDKEVKDKISSYLKKRNQTQPMKEKTCGCIFKNYKGPEGNFSAGQLIDLLGLKGLTLNNMRVSPVHGNFFENLGGAIFDDVVKLIEVVQDEVYLHYGIKLELEVKF